MHSSPSLRPGTRVSAVVLAGSVLLASLGCQDSDGPERSTPAATQPTDAATGSTPTSAGSAKDAAQTADNMTQVGAPPKRPADPNKPDAMQSMEEDAAAPGGNDAPSKGADPNMPAMPDTTSCTTDSDCKTFDSMCGSCRCLVMSKQAKPPGCSEPMVTCVVAPCLDKAAVCRSGTCTLKDVGPNTI